MERTSAEEVLCAWVGVERSCTRDRPAIVEREGQLGDSGHPFARRPSLMRNLDHWKGILKEVLEHRSFEMNSS